MTNEMMYEGKQKSQADIDDKDIRVRRMSDDEHEGSEASSSAKNFPDREIVAGNRHPDAEEEDLEMAVNLEGNTENAVEDSAEQQVLMDTQLDGHGEVMDVVEGGMAAAGSSTTEEVRDGSFGDGRVQSNLHRWLL